MTLPNTIIQAGAGTGKTYQIMQLLCRGLNSGQFDIDTVAVITFTRKAAAELKERVMSMLQKEASTNPGLQQQLLNIGNAHISTIHSFCESLLKALPVEAGIDPAFTILEEGAEKQFFSDVFDQWLVGKLEHQPEDLQLLCVENGIPLYPPDFDPSGGQHDKSLRGVLKRVIQHRELDLFSPDPAIAPNKEIHELNAKFQTAATALIDQAKCIEKSEKLTALMEAFLSGIKSIPEEPAAGFPGRLKDKKLKHKFASAGGGACEHVRDAWTPLCEDFILDTKLAVFFPTVSSCYQACNRLAEDFRNYYREAMRLAGVMDFTEILIKTEELLRTHRDARDYFKKKFKYLFVDEFQDTDPIQAHIVFFLAEREGDFASGWQDVVLAKNKLCVVGDPKQSIYRFRRADIAIYSEVSEKIAAAGRRTTLNKSFRSGEGVLNWINGFFADHLKKPEKGDWQVDYEAITIADKADRDKGDAPNRDLDNKGDIIFVQPDVITSAKDKWKADEARDIEARTTAKWIKDHAAHYGGYQNILVLYRKFNNTQLTADMLEELGVPCEIVGGKSFFSRQEVLDLNLFLRAIVDPLDSVAILAALRGPFFCLTDAQLCEWKLQDPEKRWFAHHGKATKDLDPAHPVSSALIQLRELYEGSRTLTAHEILKHEVAKRKLLVSYRASWQGSRRAMNIIKALEFLKSFDALPARHAVKEFTRRIKEKADMTDFSSHTGQGKAVQLMSIHGAKGLQRRVVYLADTTSRQFRPDKHYIDNKQGKLFYALNIPAVDAVKLELPELKALNALEEQKIDAEESRLRYVAATRAIEALVVNHRPAKLHSDNTTFRPLEKSCTTATPVDISKVAASYKLMIPSAKAKKDYSAEWSAQQTSLQGTIEELTVPSMIITSPSSAKKQDDDAPFVVEVQHDPADYTYRVEPKYAALVGTLVHKLLELQPAPEHLETVVDALLKEAGAGFEPRTIIERYQSIQAKVEALCQGATSVLREVPVKYHDAGVYYDGVIDLLIEKDTGWTIVDYKILTAEHTPEEVASTYATQMRAYKKGLEQLGLKVEKAELLTSQDAI